MIGRCRSVPGQTITKPPGLPRTALVSALKDAGAWELTSHMLPLNFRVPDVKGTVLPALQGDVGLFPHSGAWCLELTHVGCHQGPRETGPWGSWVTSENLRLETVPWREAWTPGSQQGLDLKRSQPELTSLPCVVVLPSTDHPLDTLWCRVCCVAPTRV